MTMTWQEEGRRYAIAPPNADEDLQGRRLFVADNDGDLEPALEILSGPHSGLQEITATWHRPVRPLLVQRLATEVVTELLDGVVRRSEFGWPQANIARALSWVGREVGRWWGPEWPLDGASAEEKSYAAPDAEAVPFAWLGLALDTGDVEVTTYQDDAYFGLLFAPQVRDALVDNDPRYFRLHESLPLPVGRIEQVTLAIDRTTLDDPLSDVVLAEATLVVGGRLVPLVAAENYGPDEWHRLDESVVVLREPGAADRINWLPPQPARRQPSANHVAPLDAVRYGHPRDGV
ncbi:hypothetical protein ACIGB8_02710 [Promicromonospora sukumoe]|uniref:hypothetical protein n=1 Tax=Promicromonospora sukumoe TaxID=88382 RepID=UPI0037C85708